MKKRTIDLSDSTKLFILVNNAYCAPCLPKLIDSANTLHKAYVVISLSEKSKSAMKFETTELKKNGINPKSIYFQFSKKEDPFTFKKNNKIFMDFDSVVSPFALTWVDGKIVKFY